jgi:type II secretory pathway component PulF
MAWVYDGTRTGEETFMDIAGGLRRLLGEPIPLQTLAFFFDQFATLLATGMPVNEAIRRAAPPNDAELQSIAAAVERPLQAGVPLHRALAPYYARLPEIVLPILEVGEVSGTLEGAARRLAVAFSQTAAVERRFRTAIFDPWLVIAGLSFTKAAMTPVDTSAQTAIVALTTFLTLAGLYIVARKSLPLLLRWQRLRLAIDTLKLALPHGGTIFRNLSAARWGRSFATLWNAGVPVSTALEVSSRSALNAHYERALRQAAQHTREGQSLSESLRPTQLLPAYLTDILRTGEMSGNLGHSLEQFVRILEDEAFTRATQEFVVYVSVAKLVGTVAVVAMALR